MGAPEDRNACPSPRARPAARTRRCRGLRARARGRGRGRVPVGDVVDAGDTDGALEGAEDVLAAVREARDVVRTPQILLEHQPARLHAEACARWRGAVTRAGGAARGAARPWLHGTRGGVRGNVTSYSHYTYGTSLGGRTLIPKEHLRDLQERLGVVERAHDVAHIAHLRVMVVIITHHDRCHDTSWSSSSKSFSTQLPGAVEAAAGGVVWGRAAGRCLPVAREEKLVHVERRHPPAQSDLVRFGLVWSDLVWFGCRSALPSGAAAAGRRSAPRLVTVLVRAVQECLLLRMACRPRAWQRCGHGR